MPRAYINLEDTADGIVTCNVVFDDALAQGFNQHSAAHHAARLVLQELDKIMTKAPESESESVVSAPIVTEGGIPFADQEMTDAGNGVVLA